jgi:peptidoglycan-associated lipoprotein
MKSVRSLKMLCFTVVLAVGLFSLWGCPKKAEVSATPEAQQEAAPAVQEEQKPEAAVTEEAKPGERAAPAAAGLQPVYFDFDQSFIRDDAKSVMESNAEWLKAHPRTKVRIEGNCDERAASAKKYLTDMGISGSRISLISYGKEKPSCTESTESCWQKNRRDDVTAVSE